MIGLADQQWTDLNTGEVFTQPGWVHTMDRWDSQRDGQWSVGLTSRYFTSLNIVMVALEFAGTDAERAYAIFAELVRRPRSRHP